jgi:feruloyl esterase
MTMRIVPLLLASCGLVFAGIPVAAQTSVSAPGAGSSDKCAQLTHLTLPSASITTAKTYAAGTFVGPPEYFTGADLSAFYSKLPEFCRVIVDAKPSADSDIKIEVWMPIDEWNGRLQGTGNGGFAGQIALDELGALMAKGYAATATDAGHTGSPVDATWALGHREKVIDFGHRGIHEMTRVARLVVEQFYGSAPRHAYFAGCSDGGREALMEAQRYPADYDGILAGAPANNWPGLLSMAAADTDALVVPPGAFIPQSKIPTIAHAVTAACDEIDGLRDGILNDPRQCKFDPVSIQCKDGEDTDKCLTGPQVTALKVIYAGLRDAKGQLVHPGYLPGAEEEMGGFGGWDAWIIGPAPEKSTISFFANGFFSDMVFEKTVWDVKTFNVDRDLPIARQKTAAAIDAVNPNLSAFRSHGGKLILYHGWNDPAIPALNTVNYYEEVIGSMGRANADSFVRLYMVPGMQHCFGGPGADEFGGAGSFTWASDPQRNARTALENWVEKGTAPGVIIASKIEGAAPTTVGSVVMTRPLCPYPQQAHYKGSGDPNRYENFTCATAKK